MEDQEIDLRRIFNVLRRRLKFILAFTFFVVAISAAVLFTITPRYTASTKLLLDVAGQNLLEPDATVPSTSLANAILDSEVEVINSEPVQLDAFDKLGLIKTDEFGVSLSALEKIAVFFGMEPASGTRTGEELLKNAFGNFKDNVSVRRQATTFVIEVSAVSEHPQRAADIANEVAQSHIKLKLRKSLEDSMAAQNLLDSRIAATRSLVEDAENRLQTFISSNLDEIAQKTSDLNVSSLRDRLRKLERNSKERRQLISELQKDNDNVDWNSLTSSLVSESLSVAVRKRAELNARLNQAPEGTDAELEAELADLEKQLSELAKQELTALTVVEQETPELANELQSELRERVFEIELPPSILTELYQIRTNADVARRQYERLVARASDIQAQSQVQRSDIRVISPATAPRSPSYPNKRLLLLLALVAGSGIAVGLALVYDQFLGGITSDEQLEDIISHRVASVVPSYQLHNDQSDKKSGLAPAIDVAPTSSFAESIRRIRSEIDLTLRSESHNSETGEGKVILVSSAVPSEGKSTIAISLAKSIAASGARTLLMDADLRKPSIHRYLEIEGESGLVDFLSNPEDNGALTQSLKKSVGPNLDALVGISKVGIASDTLVSGPGIQRLINSGKKHYKYVIIDSPPILPIVDTSYMLAHVDAVVCVVAFGRTSQQQVRKTIALLNQYLRKGVEVFPVLNMSDKIASGYGGQYDGYYDES